MESFERYKNITPEQYNKKGLCYFLWREPSDRKILPVISSVAGKTVCDVGCGAGYYAEFFLKNHNKVIGIDRNPHLCKLNIRLFKEDATKFSNKLNHRKMNVVFAGWLTEYLSQKSLLGFFQESYKVLLEDGELIATIINNKGWGWLYVKLAKVVRGIDKYYYKKGTVLKVLREIGFEDVQAINLNSWLGIPWAYLIIAKKNKKNRICFIAPKAYSLFTNQNYKKGLFGGGEVQLLFIAKELTRDEDFSVDFLVADYGQDSIEKYGDIKVHKSFSFQDFRLLALLKLVLTLKKINSDVYVQRALDPGSGVVALFCKIFNKKMVYMTAHDKEVDGAYEKNHSFVINFISNLVFKFADIVVSQSEYQRTLLKKNKKRDSIIIKSGYYISENINKTSDGSILWVARCEKWKNPESFIKLAELNPEYNFVMICPAAFQQEQYFKEIKEKAKKIENLKFIDFVPFNKIESYFLKAKLFVNTSNKEGFPNTFIQAAKNKIPILTLNIGRGNFLEKYKCGFFCNNQFDILNKRLKALMYDAALYKAMSKNAYNYAKENHDIKPNTQKLFKLLKAL